MRRARDSGSEWLPCGSHCRKGARGFAEAGKGPRWSGIFRQRAHLAQSAVGRAYAHAHIAALDSAWARPGARAADAGRYSRAAERDHERWVRVCSVKLLLVRIALVSDLH